MGPQASKSSREALTLRANLFQQQPKVAGIHPIRRATLFVSKQEVQTQQSRASVFIPNPTATSFLKHEPVTTYTVFHTRPLRSDRLLINFGTLILIGSVTFWYTNREYVFLNKLGRIRLMAISWDTEKILGYKLRSDLEAIGEKDFGPELPPNDYRRVEVEAIAQRIIEAAEQDFFAIRKRLDWRIYVRESSVENAYCQIGGTLTVFTGMIDKFIEAERLGLVKDARNAIACILAHEIAHGYCRHSSEVMGWMPFEFPFKFLIKDSNFFSALFNLVLNLPFSRMCEVEADLVGLELMARAGFDPEEATRVYVLLGDLPQFLEFALTHPVGEHRAKIIEKHLPDAMRLYEVYKNRPEGKPGPSIPVSISSFVARWVRGLPSKSSTSERKRLSDIDSEQKLKPLMVSRQTYALQSSKDQLNATGIDEQRHFTIKRKLIDMDCWA